MEEQEDNSRLKVMTEDDIVASVANSDKENSSEDKVPIMKINSSILRIYINALLDYALLQIPRSWNKNRKFS